MTDYVEINGETLTKNEAIQRELAEFMQKIDTERQENLMRKKPLPIKWNTRIHNRLEIILLKQEKPIPNSEAQNIEADKFYQMYMDYCDLCCWIEDELCISYYKTKPEFCAYCAITTQAFEWIKKEGDYHQREALCNIEDKMSDSTLMSAENAEIKSKPAETRLAAKGGVGYSMQTVNNKEIIAVTAFSPNQLTPDNELEPPKLKLPQGD